MSTDGVTKPRGLRGFRANVSPLVVLLSAVIVLLLLLIAQSPPTVIREVEESQHTPFLELQSTKEESSESQEDSLNKSEDLTTSLAHTRSDWKYGAEAEVCKPIFDKLERNGFLCGLYERSGSCTVPDDWRDFKAKGVWMFSQFMQDAYVYIKHFTRLNRRGVYLDIASNDPIKLSNTYFYDRCLGWKGICVEANEMYYEPTFRERSCQLVPTCAGSAEGETVKFRLRGEIGGVVGDSYKYGNSSQGTIVEKRCTTAQAALDRNSISHVDWMSLDVEGHELHVLKGIDFGRTKIDVITIEVTPSFKEVQKMLLGLGYERHWVGEESEKSPHGEGFLGLDAIFVRAGVRFGYPV